MSNGPESSDAVSQGVRGRGAVLIANCDCSPGECWEIRCSDCGRLAEAYDDETGDDYVAHWPTEDDALDGCQTIGFEYWDDEQGEPVLCGYCTDRRLADE